MQLSIKAVQRKPNDQKNKVPLSQTILIFLNVFHYENKDCNLSLWPGSSLLNALQSPINLFFIFTLLFSWLSSPAFWYHIASGHLLNRGEGGVFFFSSRKIFILPSFTKCARYFVMTSNCFFNFLSKIYLNKNAKSVLQIHTVLCFLVPSGASLGKILLPKCVVKQYLKLGSYKRSCSKVRGKLGKAHSLTTELAPTEITQTKTSPTSFPNWLT